MNILADFYNLYDIAKSPEDWLHRTYQLSFDMLDTPTIYNCLSGQLDEVRAKKGSNGQYSKISLFFKGQKKGHYFSLSYSPYKLYFRYSVKKLGSYNPVIIEYDVKSNVERSSFKMRLARY